MKPIKSLLIILFFLNPCILLAQNVIVLSVNQPPEFGFFVGKKDTTIVRGASLEVGTGMDFFIGKGENNLHNQVVYTT